VPQYSNFDMVFSVSFLPTHSALLALGRLEKDWLAA
jgi:hypothetical protein